MTSNCSIKDCKRKVVYHLPEELCKLHYNDIYYKNPKNKLQKKDGWKRGKLFQLNYNPNIPSDVSLRPKIWIKAERLSFFDLNTAIEEKIKRWC